MAPLGVLTQTRTTAEAAPPPGWHLAGLWRFDELWIDPAESPAFGDWSQTQSTRRGCEADV
jgi:hypothetical protein